MILLILLIVVVAIVLVASAISRSKRPLPPDIEFCVTNGVAHVLIRGDGTASQIEMDDRAWFESLTPEERQAHLDWETAETEKWLKWAEGHR